MLSIFSFVKLFLYNISAKSQILLGYPNYIFILQLNLWRYGDFTEDDAKEFGYKK